MFLLSAQNIFHIILTSSVEAAKKNSSLNFMSSVGFQASKIWMFSFWKFTVELVLESFSGRNNSLEPPVLGFSNSLPYGLEKLSEL